MNRRYTYVAIVGSRDASEDQVELAFTDLNPAKHVIVSGGARGADNAAKLIAISLGYHYVEAPAIWSRGITAGHARNGVIVDIADRVIAVWDGKSRGTANTIDKAKAKGIPIEVIW